MTPARNPRIACSVRPWAYSARSSDRSDTACGVIQPAQTLSRGKTALSITTTSAPASRSFRAQEDPPGPPPTIRTSQPSMRMYRPSFLASGVDHAKEPAAILDSQSAHTDPWDAVALLPRKRHLKQLHPSGSERHLRAGEIQTPGADENVVEHPRHDIRSIVEPVQPMVERLLIVQTKVFDVEH